MEQLIILLSSLFSINISTNVSARNSASFTFDGSGD